MKHFPLLFTFVLLNISSSAQSKKAVTLTSPIPIKIQFVNRLSGDFSFKKKWSYPMGVGLNDYGQVICDGFCTYEADLMKDSTGRIYDDSLAAFYEIVDTTHEQHTIECDARCYEWSGTDIMKVFLKNRDSFYAYTMCNQGTHCSLNLSIVKGVCYATINLRSIMPNGDAVFYCKGGYITIDKTLWDKGIMKAEFNFIFDEAENPKLPMFWKGKIYAEIKNEE